jgi:hypothetical protein
VLVERGLPLLAVVGPVVPHLISKVATEEASYLFGSWVLTVEEPTGGEVVGIATERELRVGGEGLLWVVL